MNFSQYAGIFRIIVPMAVTYVVSKGWITEDAITQIGTIIATFAAAGGWSAAANTQLNLAKTVAAVRGLQVAVGPTAPPELQTAAHDRTDPSVRDIVPVPLVPNQYATTGRQQRE